MTLYLHALGFGLVTASILALASVGLTLQFGVTNYVNFAYGAMLTGVLGIILNLIILAPFVKRGYPVLFMLVVTFGLSLILANVLLAIWGADFRQYKVAPDTSYDIGPFLFTGRQLVIIGIAAVAMVGVHVL